MHYLGDQMTKRAFGELELAILHILKSGKRATVKEVHQILGEDNKYNTIMTVMLRLSEKDVLARERVGAHYEYWLLPAKAKIPSFMEKFKKKVFGLKPTEMVSYLIESEDITDEEIAEMEQMLEKAKALRKKVNNS
jgi:predicted transcriptional regulator